MSRQELKARDKKVQKMARSGLTEHNLTQGTMQRISSRPAEISFQRAKGEDMQVPPEGECKKKTAKEGPENIPAPTVPKSRKKKVQPEEANIQGVQEPEETDRFAGAAAPEVWEPRNAPASMRDAGDRPALSDRQRQADSTFEERETAAEEIKEEMQEPNPGRPLRNPVQSRTVKTGRIYFKNGKALKTRKRKKLSDAKKRQAAQPPEDNGVQLGKKLSDIPLKSRTQPVHGDTEEPGAWDHTPANREQDVGADTDAAEYRVDAMQNAEMKKAVLHGRKCGWLRFASADTKDMDIKNGTEMRKRQTMKFAVDGVKRGEGVPEERGEKQEAVSGRGKLHFEKEAVLEAADVHKSGAAINKKQASEQAACAAKTDKSRRYCHEKDIVHPEGRTADMQDGAGHSDRKKAGKSKRQKKYEKAQKQMEKAGSRLEKAQGRIPGYRRACIQKQYDSGSGKVKHRLQFGNGETVPENGMHPLPKQHGRAVLRDSFAVVSGKAHQKIRETEQDNTGVEAAHKTELMAERGTGQYLRWNKRRIHEKPYRKVRRAEKCLAEAKVNAAYQKLSVEHPELEKRVFAKWVQKQKLKRKYADAARKMPKGVQTAANVLHTPGQAVRKMAQNMAARKTVSGIVIVCILSLSLSGSLFSSCSAMLTGIQSAVLAACYIADDAEIDRSELKYTELEAGLQVDISSTETDFPGYDEYRYNIGEIGHNPYELMGYLSAAYGDFTYAQIEAELYRLFGLQYQLAREVAIETRTYMDDAGEMQEYEWRILKTTLYVRPLSEIIAGSLPAGGQADRYAVYMQTCGGRQCYGSPFDAAWLSYVTSPYGYRVNPVTGAKELHRGIDIGMAEGTPVRAVQDGRVSAAGYSGDYGLCVVVEDGNGCQSRYAHCSSISVIPGQEVKRGDVIAAVGNTGDSTGPYLHLEVSRNGDYLNPYYYVDNGGDGYLADGGAAGGPVIPDDPGHAMGDGSFATMLEEAEKYLGFPYVWGGSSPSTSFDCSGFVSWVVNHSGVGNVGRQTAQGLYNLCTPVSRENMQPGDLVFFTGTYSSASPVTHVGIYVGGNRMIHCGDPIAFADLSSNYWISHYYSGGRLP